LKNRIELDYVIAQSQGGSLFFFIL